MCPHLILCPHWTPFENPTTAPDWKHVLRKSSRNYLWPVYRKHYRSYSEPPIDVRRIIDVDLIIVKDGSRPATNPSRTRPRGSAAARTLSISNIDHHQLAVLAGCQRQPGDRAPCRRDRSITLGGMRAASSSR